MASEHLSVDHDDGVVTITVDRPARRNALHGPLWDGLRDAATALASDPPRVVILHGAGEHFCAGMDLRPDNPLVSDLAPAIAMKDPDACRAVIERLKASMNAIASLPCPVVAAIEGSCLGGGLELALTADLRVAGESARFSMPETRWGLVPDVGGTVRLTRLVGRGRSADLILTGRTIDAREALAWGLVSQVVPDGSTLERARELAASIIKGAPLATREALAVLRQVDALDDAAAFEAETQAGVTTLIGQEAMEGLAAFATKQAPRWAR